MYKEVEYDDYIPVKIRKLCSELNRLEQNCKKIIVDIDNASLKSKIKYIHYVKLLSKTASSLCNLSILLLSKGVDIDEK